MSWQWRQWCLCACLWGYEHDWWLFGHETDRSSVVWSVFRVHSWSRRAEPHFLQRSVMVPLFAFIMKKKRVPCYFIYSKLSQYRCVWMFCPLSWLSAYSWISLLIWRSAGSQNKTRNKLVRFFFSPSWQVALPELLISLCFRPVWSYLIWAYSPALNVALFCVMPFNCLSVVMKYFQLWPHTRDKSYMILNLSTKLKRSR